jgi:hypothetical protein
VTVSACQTKGCPLVFVFEDFSKYIPRSIVSFVYYCSWHLDIWISSLYAITV